MFPGPCGLRPPPPAQRDVVPHYRVCREDGGSSVSSVCQPCQSVVRLSLIKRGGLLVPYFLHTTHSFSCEIVSSPTLTPLGFVPNYTSERERNWRNSWKSSYRHFCSSHFTTPDLYDLRTTNFFCRSMTYFYKTK